MAPKAAERPAEGVEFPLDGEGKRSTTGVNSELSGWDVPEADVGLCDILPQCAIVRSPFDTGHLR